MVLFLSWYVTEFNTNLHTVHANKTLQVSRDNFNYIPIKIYIIVSVIKRDENKTSNMRDRKRILMQMFQHLIVDFSIYLNYTLYYTHGTYINV